MNVLVVEDNKSINLTLCTTIGGMGHDAVAAESGEEALNIFSTESTDLILMDVEMPGMDGFETTKRIRSVAKELWVPIIFLSANADDSYLVDGIEAGGDDYLVKPVRPSVLKAKIRAMERIAHMRDELRRVNKELEKARAEFERLSYLDGLTEIVNRRGFELGFAQEWQRCEREKMPITLVMIDIDHFKQYNDFYGHLKGDDCLKQVAQCLATTINRGGDVVARYGGEEFVILLPNTDADGGSIVAKRIIKEVYDLDIEHREHSLKRVTISAGLCSTVPAEQTMSDAKLLEHADEALYQAKHQGRNRFCISQDQS